MMRNLSIKARMALVGLVVVAAMGAIGGLGVFGMSVLSHNLQTVHDTSVLPLRSLKKAADAYAVNVIDAVNKTNAGLMTAEDAVKSIRGAQETVKTSWTEYRATRLSDKEVAIVKDTESLMAAADRDIERLLSVLQGKSGLVRDGLRDFDGALYTSIDPLGEKLSALIDMQVEIARDLYVSGEALYASKRTVVVAGCAAAALLLVGFGWLLYRNIVPPMLGLADRMRAITAGDRSVEVDLDRSDELGDVVTAFKGLYGKIQADLQDSRQVAMANERIRQALEATSSAVMVADVEGNIIFANTAVVSLLKSREATMRQQYPGFSAENLVGVSFDTFHRSASHQRNLLASLTTAHRTDVKIADLTMRLSASPIRDTDGSRIGTVVEWVDRTDELAVEEQVSALVSAAAAGDFSKRLPTQGKQGFMLRIADSLNQVMSVTDTSVTEVGRVSQALARGDLTQVVTGDFQGQLAQLQADMNMAVGNLRDLIDSLRLATESIDTAAKEIAAGNQDLSGRTEEQASSLEETASSMEELTSTVKQNAENARQANQLVIGASDVAVRGGEVVRQVVSTMGGISESSKKIADIISVIDGIAFQTNILALNAAVEAARAGEQGRGFAVVATEVRNLAQRSAAAAKEIKELIVDSVGKVESGSRLVDEAGRTMEEIVMSVKRVTDIMAEITAASMEQSSGIEQVNQAVTQMDEATQQNAALVEEAAAAAESLEEQARSLSDAVSRFRVADGGLGSAEWDGAERRGPDRAKNVSRLPKKAAQAAPVAPAEALAKAPVAKKSRVAGGAAAEGEWEEF